MDDADNILITSLKNIGMYLNIEFNHYRTVATLNDFDSESLIIALIKCFERISSMLNEQDNFIDLKYMKS